MSETSLFYFNASLQLQFSMSNEKPGACPYEMAAHIEGLDLTNELEFLAPANNEDAAQLSEGGYIGFFDKDNNFQLFEIYLIEEEDSFTEGLKRQVFADHVFNETDKLPVYDKRPQNTTAAAALDSLLEGQVKWKRGQVDDLGLNSTNFYHESIRSGIKKILEKWGGELRPRVTFTGNTITGFYIDILTRRGADTGKRITIEKGAENIKRKIDRTNIYTAVVPRGKGEETETGGYSRRLTIANVEWSAGDPANKPTGQIFIGDEAARLAYGIPDGNGNKLHRFLFIEFDEETDAENLALMGWETLQQNNKPLVSYEIKMVDLEPQGLSHEAIRLGDTNFILDEEFKPALATEARIIKLKRILDDESQTEPELGNFMPLFTDSTNSIKQLQELVGGRAGIWDKATEPVGDGDIENITPEKPANIIATGSFKKVIVEWDFNPALYLAAYEVYGSPVPGFIADPSNLLWRGKGSAYAHEPGVNQQWYYRVRGVNTQGIAGPLSDEASATTARIITDDILFGAVNANILANLSVEARALTDLAVESRAIANLAVGNAAIANLAVDNAKLGLLSVGTAQMQDLAVTNAKIANLAIDNAKIANATITSAKISSIDAGKITTGTLTAITISGVTINGSTINSTAGTSNMTISGAKMVSAYGTYTLTFGDGELTLANTGTQRIQMSPGGMTVTDSAGWQATMAMDNGIVGWSSTGSKFHFTRDVETNGVFRAANAGDNSTLLYFATDRPWSFMQEGIDGNTKLSLRCTSTDKFFSIQNVGGEASFSVHVSGTAGNRYAVAPKFRTDVLQGSTVNDVVTIGTRSAKIDVGANIARWQQSDTHYIAQNSVGQITFYMNSAAKHWFNADGTKSAGTITIEDKNFGMSPIDSPQFLIEYIEFDILLDSAGVKVYLDTTFIKAVDYKFAIFPNNGQIIEKGLDYFVIAGTGKADCRIVGERIDYKGAFWGDMDLLTEMQEVELIEEQPYNEPQQN